MRTLLEDCRHRRRLRCQFSHLGQHPCRHLIPKKNQMKQPQQQDGPLAGIVLRAVRGLHCHHLALHCRHLALHCRHLALHCRRPQGPFLALVSCSSVCRAWHSADCDEPERKYKQIAKFSKIRIKPTLDEKHAHQKRLERCSQISNRVRAFE